MERTKDEKQFLRNLFNDTYRLGLEDIDDINYIRLFINRELLSGLPPNQRLRNAQQTYDYLAENVDVPRRTGMVEKIWKFFRAYTFEYEGIYDPETLYKVIMEEIGRIPNATSIVVFFKSPANKINSLSITSDVLALGYDEFLARINSILSGKEFGGSDRWIEDPETIGSDVDYTHFAIRVSQIQANGKSDMMLFQVVGIEGTLKKDENGKKYKYNNCSTLCLEKLGFTPKQDAEKLSNLLNLVAEIKDNDLPINIIANSFSLKRPFSDIVNSSEKKLRKDIVDKKGIPRPNVCCPVSLETDIDIIYLHKTNQAEYTLIYDEVNKHTDIILGNEFCRATPELYDDVFISISGKAIKGNTIIFTPTQINKNNLANTEEKDNTLLKYVFFDYETTIDWSKSSCMSEYSLSILVLDDNELGELCSADEDNNIEKVAVIRKNKCITFLGYDCSNKFIKWILENESNTQFVFIGFNNSSFDNFLFLGALLRNQNKYYDDYSITDIFYNGNVLLNFQMNGRHTTFDIRKHLVGSLKYNCKSFKINCCSKKEFNHDYAQQLHDDGKLIDWINGNEELKEYNEYDVLATAVLYAKYRKALLNIKATKPYALRLYETKTIGSLIYKVFDSHAKQEKYGLAKLPLQEYQDLRKYKVAGRVEMFNGVQKVLGRMVSTDVCSLYPYVMAVKDVYYPEGNITETDEYMGDDVIGFYYCDIDQTNLKNMNLPKIYPRKTEIENDWGHDEELEDYLISNVMIRLLKKYGCRVEIKSGFYWKNEVKSCEMFKFLLDFMSEKNNQDSLKQVGNESYNPALRETLKLLMNSLSGKVIEGLHTEKTQFVESVEEYMKIEKKCVKINTINEIGDKTFITYEMDESKLIAKQKPIYLGVLIYDYAKEYMYEYSYSKIGKDKLLYTDTDASKFRYEDFGKWNNWIQQENIIVPHHEEVELIDPRYKNHLIYQADSKVFGSFEDELDEMVGGEYKFYCLEKKSWCYSVDGKTKYRFKGLNDNTQVLTLQEPFLNKKEDNEGIVSYKLKPDMEQDIHKFYINNKNNSIGEGSNAVKFFEKIYTEGEAFVLTSSFRKIVKNNNRNVGYDDEDRFNKLMNSIQVKYVVKKLSIKNKV